ncbi:MAG: lysozyme inhibitor LprI family protein [Gammaproteobacteria bacterium]
MTLLILASGFSINAAAKETRACSGTTMTQLEINQCADAGYKEADAALNRTYKRIMEIYQEDKVFIEKLKKAQLAWIKLRDADFDLKFPHADEPRFYGSVLPMCATGYKEQLTLQRIAFLEQWLSGVEEGDICSGSPMPKWRLKEILGSEYR